MWNKDVVNTKDDACHCKCCKCKNYEEEEKSAFEKWESKEPRYFSVGTLQGDIFRARKEAWNAAISEVLSLKKMHLFAAHNAELSCHVVDTWGDVEKLKVD